MGEKRGQVSALPKSIRATTPGSAASSPNGSTSLVQAPQLERVHRIAHVGKTVHPQGPNILSSRSPIFSAQVSIR